MTDDGQADGVSKVLAPGERRFRNNEFEEVLAELRIGISLNQSKGGSLAIHGVSSGVTRALEVEFEGFRADRNDGIFRCRLVRLSELEAMSDRCGLSCVSFAVCGSGQEVDCLLYTSDAADE